MSWRRFACLLGLALAAAFPAWANQDWPDGWKVKVDSWLILPKQGIYSVTVTVRDQAGRPVDNAEVYIRVPSSGPGGYELVPTYHERGGRYWRPNPGRQFNPRAPDVVVKPGDTR